LTLLMMTDTASGIASCMRMNIGWARTDISPTRPAALGGMTTLRIATEVMDPLTATALVLEAPYQADDDQPLVLVGCDLRSIREDLTEGVRAEVLKRIPGLDPMRIILNATHTHTAPPLATFGIPVDAMEEP